MYFTNNYPVALTVIFCKTVCVNSRPITLYPDRISIRNVSRKHCMDYFIFIVRK